MSAFEALKDLIGNKPQPYVPALNPFLQIDVEALATEMNLEGEGSRRGAANLPSSDSRTFDDIELAITDRIETEARQAYAECVNELRVIDGRINSLDLMGSFARARSAASSALGDFVAEARLRQGRLSEKRREVKQARKHIQQFRADNRLNRLAQQPLQGMAYWGTVAGACVGETLINAVFLRVNDDFGYLGGAVMAFAIAVVNVGIATLFGKLVMPLKNSINPRAQLRGCLLLAGYAFLAITLNLVGAHYRTLKGEGVANPGAEAITSFLANPVAIADFVSWLLVAFGLGCSIAALWAGYRSDDEYPGYGRVSREYKSVLDAYNDGIEDAYETLREIKDDAHDSALKVEQALGRDRREYDAALLHRTSLLALHSQRHPSLETAANRLLGMYRTANLAQRTAPPPARFDASWTLRPLADPGTARPPSLGGQLDEELAETQRALSQALADIDAAFIRHVESFKPIDELLD